MGIPKTLDGLFHLFHGKSETQMDDDWGYPYDSGNHHVVTILGSLSHGSYDWFSSKSWTLEFWMVWGYPQLGVINWFQP